GIAARRPAEKSGSLWSGAAIVVSQATDPSMFELEENRRKVQRAMLVGVQTQKMSSEEAEGLLDELEELVANLDIPIVHRQIVKLRETNPAMLLGRGKADEIIELAKSLEADVIVFDDELTPAQQRNWEAASGIAVIDRQ